MINKSDSSFAVVRFVNHSYDYRLSWTPFIPINVTYPLQYMNLGYYFDRFTNIFIFLRLSEAVRYFLSSGHKVQPRRVSSLILAWIGERVLVGLYFHDNIGVSKTEINRAIFNWLSKVIQRALVLLYSVIGPENSRHLSTSQKKKTIVLTIVSILKQSFLDHSRFKALQAVSSL